MELVARLTRSRTDPALTRTMMRTIGREFTIDDSAARRELGYVGESHTDRRRPGGIPVTLFQRPRGVTISVGGDGIHLMHLNSL